MLFGRRQSFDDHDVGRRLAAGRPVRAPLAEPEEMAVEVSDGVFTQAPGLRLQGRVDRRAVATVEAVEDVDPFDEERMPLPADLRVWPRLKGEHRADLAPADAAEIGRFSPDPLFGEAQHVTVVAHRCDHVRDGEDRLGTADIDPLIAHGTSPAFSRQRESSTAG